MNRHQQFANTYQQACRTAAGSDAAGDLLLGLLAGRSDSGRCVPYHNFLSLPNGDMGHILLVVARRHAGQEGGGYMPACTPFGQFSGPAAGCRAAAAWFAAHPPDAVEVAQARAWLAMVARQG